MSNPKRLPPPGWYPDPSGMGGQRYWTGNSWSDQTQANVPPFAGAVPPGSWGSKPAISVRRVIWLPIALTVVGVVIAVAVFGLSNMQSRKGLDLSGMPSTLACEVQRGQQPPASMTVNYVDLDHKGNSVVIFTVNFDESPPPPADFAPAGGRVGPALSFGLSNERAGKYFALVDSDPQGGYGFMSFAKPFTNTHNVEIDDSTYARQSGNSIVISVELAKFAVDDEPYTPSITVRSSVFGGYYPVGFADQVCAA